MIRNYKNSITFDIKYRGCHNVAYCSSLKSNFRKFVSQSYKGVHVKFKFANVVLALLLQNIEKFSETKPENSNHSQNVPPITHRPVTVKPME